MLEKALYFYKKLFLEISNTPKTHIIKFCFVKLYGLTIYITKLQLTK